MKIELLAITSLAIAGYLAYRSGLNNWLVRAVIGTQWLKICFDTRYAGSNPMNDKELENLQITWKRPGLAYLLSNQKSEDYNDKVGPDTDADADVGNSVKVDEFTKLAGRRFFNIWRFFLTDRLEK